MTCTHPKADHLLKSDCFGNLSRFTEFEDRLRTLSNTKEVGDAFEVFVEAYLHTQPTMQAKHVWLVGQVPLRIRAQLNLPADSKGIDGIFETRAGELVPYQVKYRTDVDVLPYGEVSSFLGVTERSCKDRVIFTNARGLSKDVENRDGLRSVRASQFNALTRHDFAAIEAWLREKPIPHKRRQPRTYQSEAIQQITDALKTQDRTTAVMACGTGKTLVALWAAEQLEPKTVLVFVPSLALLSQTLPDWCKESKWGESLEYLCVCSDPTVSREADAYTIRPQDSDFPITTDSNVVRHFLSRATQCVRVVFSTYHSAPVVADGMKGLSPFDFAVFDEAHKTTGPKAGLFAFALNDANVPIRKRLFLTATPRHYDIRKRDKEGDFKLVSMDDEAIYGPVSYRLSFASAVKQGIICPYKIVISVTTKAEVDSHLLKHGITLVKRDSIQAKWVATQLTLKRAIQKTGASKAITFHSRVSMAKEFASSDSRGISHYLKGFEVLHVNGTQSTADREDLLADFRTATKALITNARCLTEGVDVPAVDMVAFIDPRKSKVDIAQATGRAMRQSKGTGKTTGYIVVPLFLEQRKGESEQNALERSGFEEVAMVIAAMQEQDEDLVDVIRQLRQEKGEGKPFKPRRLTEKVEVIGLPIALRELMSAVQIQVVDRLSDNWDEMFGKMLRYQLENGDCRVSAYGGDEEAAVLTRWAIKQRSKRDMLSDKRRVRLESLIGWTWDPRQSDWDDAYEALMRHSEKTHSCLVPKSLQTARGVSVRDWVITQRVWRDRLTSERRCRLESLAGWTWDPLEEDWHRAYEELRSYARIKGSAQVPIHYKTKGGYPLGKWVRKQRQAKSRLVADRAARLEQVMGWSWNPLQAAWALAMAKLKQYQERNGDALVPDGFKTADGFALGKWVVNQRQSKTELSPQRRAQVEGISGWSWNPHAESWEQGYAKLCEYQKRVGHCRRYTVWTTKWCRRFSRKSCEMRWTPMRWLSKCTSTRDAAMSTRSPRSPSLRAFELQRWRTR